MTPIETQRLVLRPFVLQDLDAFARINGDKDVRHFMWDGLLTREQSAEELDRILAAYETESPDYFAIVDRASGRLIGQCGVFVSQEGRHAALAYLLDKERWGRGLALEATVAMLHTTLDQFPVETISATTPSEHMVSRRVIEKLGMSYARGDRRKGVGVVVYETTATPFWPNIRVSDRRERREQFWRSVRPRTRPAVAAPRPAPTLARAANAGLDRTPFDVLFSIQTPNGVAYEAGAQRSHMRVEGRGSELHARCLQCGGRSDSPPAAPLAGRRR